MEWFRRDFDHPLYFRIYRDKEIDALEEGPALVRALGLPAGSRVLDLPCGWGRLNPFLQRASYEVIGGDLSPLNLQRHAREHPTPLVRLDLRCLPFRDACADGVLCAYTSWGYFARDEENLRQLQEFARVLRPNGVLVLDLVGREALERLAAPLENQWFEVDGYRERVRWSPDRRRVFTDRILDGVHFRHDIWIPTYEEVRTFATRAGLALEEAWGGLHQEPFRTNAERWIFRFRRSSPS